MHRHKSSESVANELDRVDFAALRGGLSHDTAAGNPTEPRVDRGLMPFHEHDVPPEVQDYLRLNRLNS
jgi:hypothetical protein